MATKLNADIRSQIVQRSHRVEGKAKSATGPRNGREGACPTHEETMSYRDGKTKWALDIIQAQSRILRGDLTKTIQSMSIDDILTTIKPASVEDQAHEAIVREFDPDYLPRLQRMMDRMRAEMMKAVAVSDEFMQTVVDHKSLAMQMEEAIAREKKR